MRLLLIIFTYFKVINFINCKHIDTNNNKYKMHHIPEFDSSKYSNRYKRQSSNDENQENSAYYWNIGAQLKLREQLLKQQNYNIAKNVIFFLGDGMSIPTLAASRIYLGQMQGHTGEESRLYFEDFPYVGLAKTYCIDTQVADSACTATAYLAGIKANVGTIGVSGDVKLSDCKAQNKKQNQVDSIAKWAQNAGKGTGIVTTTRVTHASPSGAFAHTSHRDYECDADVVMAKNDPKMCQDIASQLIYNEPGNKFKVILGGGRSKFLPNITKDDDGNFGQRLDAQNLIKTWQRTKKNGAAAYVSDKNGLQNLNYITTDYLLGLFAPSHMSYNLEADHDKEPTLAEMTAAAIRILQKESKGYFLFVEGGRIDHGHHESKARKALDETVQFAEAIRLANELTSSQDTLIIVSSDHAHTMSISGYPARGNDILGLSTMNSDVDNLPYATLNYANGGGYHTSGENKTRYDLTTDDLKDLNYQYPGLFPMSIETHGGDDVGVFAIGPWAHLFTGVYEQNVIPHMLAYASCIGNGLTACGRQR